MVNDDPAAALDGMQRVLGGRYVMEREVGRGATSIVHLGRDLETPRSVAVKVLRPEFAESIGATQFLKEIRHTIELSHANIVPVLDSGSEDGVPYYVLPYFAGGTLRSRLEREKQLPFADALAIAHTVASALDHAHSRNLVHRDVKPENILFDEQGVAHLADFGIARALISASGDTVTSATIIRGTIPYMSPEQASGDPGLDGRSDIYSLACVLYEMVGGVQPFVGASPQSIMTQRLTHMPQPVRVYRPSVPAELERVLEKAFAIAPADRYGTAGEFAAAMDAVADLIASGRATTGDNAARAARNRRRMIPAVGFGLLAVTAAAWVLWPSKSPADARPLRIAVLSFEPSAPDSGLALIGRALASDVIDALRHAPELQLLAGAALRSVPAGVSLDSLGKALQVGTFVTGNLELRGDSVRVGVHIVDALTHVDRAPHPISAQVPRARLLELRDTVIERVARELLGEFGREARLREWRAGTRSSRAWELRHRADEIAEFARSLPRQAASFAPQFAALQAADSLLRAASAADPEWAEPYVARGWIRHQRTGYVGSAAEAGELAAAESLANLALQRRAGDPRALELRGTVRVIQWSNLPGSPRTLRDSAEADLHAALRADEHLPRAWWALSLLRDMGADTAGAKDAARRAHEADAYFVELNRTLIRLLFNDARQRRPDSARAKCARARALFPEDPVVRTCELTLLGWFGRSANDVRVAWRELAWMEAAGPWPLVDGEYPDGRFFIAAILARSGQRDSARRVADRTIARLNRAGYAGTYRIREALVLTALGDNAGALALLEAAVRADPSARAWIDHPWFDPLRADPRFERLLKGR